jgi:hypothetical protein
MPADAGKIAGSETRTMNRNTHLTARRLAAMAALLLAGASLGGCIVYPDGGYYRPYHYHYGYD